MRKLVLISFFSFLFCGAASAFTVNRNHAWVIVPSISSYYYASKRHVDDQMMPGVSLGYGLTHSISAELYFGRIITNQSRANKQDVRGALYTLDGFYYFRPTSQFQPYLLAGVGVMHLSPTNVNDTDTQANINGGAGVTYFFSQQIALRADVRDIYTIVGGKHDFSANLGVQIMLGGKNDTADEGEAE